MFTYMYKDVYKYDNNKISTELRIRLGKTACEKRGWFGVRIYGIGLSL